jgi:hypothetical protein
LEISVIGHTDSFAAYKELSQAHIDFAVLVCYAVPLLKSELASPNALSCQPDHFKPKATTKVHLTKHAANYQDELARTLHISIFSYFESYVREALREIADFHGGNGQIKSLAHKRAAKFLAAPPVEVQKSKRKLQEPSKPNERDKYMKHSALLEKAGFRFPTELFAHYGVTQMLAKASDDKNGLRAWEIPNILADCLLFPITKTERDFYEDNRQLRNKIAHGTVPKLALKDSLGFSSRLHTLAAKIDNHLVEHFFVLQKFT